MNSRRNLLIALGAAVLAPQKLFAQAKQPVLIGWLSFQPGSGNSFAAFKEELAVLGWKEGAQIMIDARWADGRDDRLAPLVQELAARKPALIVAWSLRVAVRAARAAPKMPIVMLATGDPIGTGLVTSLARPGGMVTGLASFGTDLVGKHLENSRQHENRQSARPDDAARDHGAGNSSDRMSYRARGRAATRSLNDLPSAVSARRCHRRSWCVRIG